MIFWNYLWRSSFEEINFFVVIALATFIFINSIFVSDALIAWICRKLLLLCLRWFGFGYDFVNSSESKDHSNDFEDCRYFRCVDKLHEIGDKDTYVIREWVQSRIFRNNRTLYEKDLTYERRDCHENDVKKQIRKRRQRNNICPRNECDCSEEHKIESKIMINCYRCCRWREFRNHYCNRPEDLAEEVD